MALDVKMWKKAYVSIHVTLDDKYQLWEWIDEYIRDMPKNSILVHIPNFQLYFSNRGTYTDTTTIFTSKISVWRHFCVTSLTVEQRQSTKRCNALLSITWDLNNLDRPSRCRDTDILPRKWMIDSMMLVAMETGSYLDSRPDSDNMNGSFGNLGPSPFDRYQIHRWHI